MNILLDPAARPIIGHRGASGLAPENTVPAFGLALAERADAIELDVRQSADGTPIVLHDPSVDRTTDSTGLVSDLRLSQVQLLDAGYWFSSDGGHKFPFRGLGVRIPTLLEVLTTFPTTPILIEIKDPNAQKRVVDLIRALHAEPRCVVASFRHEALAAFRRAGIATGAARRDIVRLFFRARTGIPIPVGRCRFYAVPERWHRIEVPTTAFIRLAERKGRPVHLWTVNDPGQAARLWERGVSGIITNFPKRMREELERWLGKT